jgi:hypothetical protein
VLARDQDASWARTTDLWVLGTAWRAARFCESHPGPKPPTTTTGTKATTTGTGAEPEPKTPTEVAEAAEAQLRELFTAPMRLYDDLVAAGVPRHAAMAHAAARMATTRMTRPSTVPVRDAFGAARRRWGSAGLPTRSRPSRPGTAGRSHLMWRRTTGSTLPRSARITRPPRSTYGGSWPDARPHPVGRDRPQSTQRKEPP